MGLKFPSRLWDYCNNWFMIPINLNLDPATDSAKGRGNLTIDYQFAAVTDYPIAVPNHGSTSMRVNLLFLDQNVHTMFKEKGITQAVV